MILAKKMTGADGYFQCVNGHAGKTKKEVPFQEPPGFK